MTDIESFFLRLVENGRLIVREDGTVFNTTTNRFIGSGEHADGGGYVIAVKDGEKHKSMLKHRLVWLCFRGEIPADMRVIYKHERLNDSLANLEMVHHSDKRLHGNTVGRAGTTNPQSKLTDDIVVAARTAYRNGTTIPELAAKYHVSKVTMLFAITGRQWKHVPDPVLERPKKEKKPRVRKPYVKVKKAKPVLAPHVIRTVDPKIKGLAQAFLQRFRA